MRLSVYMSIFDDWDLLPDALAAVAPFADEIVIVDGAYRWMAPMLEANGRDPRHSVPEVAACFTPYLHKLRILSGLWEDEMDKRSTGYAACQGRYVLRFDADEIMFLTQELIAAAIARGYPVASVEMPTYTLPGWISTHLREDGTLGDIERQCVFFDRSVISAEEHLTYLWLVLGKAEKARLGKPDLRKVDPIPLAYNAHLTCWRSPQTSAHRARFYVMNWMRDEETVPWLGGIAARQEDGFSAFFAALSPSEFQSLLRGHEISAGQPGFGNWAIRRAPSDPVYDRLITDHFVCFLRSLAELNRNLAADGGLLLSGVPCCLDLSTLDAVAALAPRGNLIALTFDQGITACEAVVMTISSPDGDIGLGVTEQAEVRLDGETVTLTLPDLPPHLAGKPIRRTLMLRATADWTRKLRLIALGAFPADLAATAGVNTGLEAARAATEVADWKLATLYWREVVAANRDSEEAHLRLGEAFLGANRFEEADEFCFQAWNRFPDNIWIGRNWALSAMRKRDWSVAIERFNDVGRTHPHDALEADRAECLLAMGRSSEAAAVVSDALLRFPKSPWLLRLETRGVPLPRSDEPQAAQFGRTLL
jgi:tetratricopeptide (TPR) repeat protein